MLARLAVNRELREAIKHNTIRGSKNEGSLNIAANRLVQRGKDIGNVTRLEVP